MSTTSTPEIPERFRVARPTLMLDRFMTHFIKGGGFAIIAAVFLIFVFIGIQVIPLFRGASVAEEAVYDIPTDDIAVFGIDEYGELPFFVSSSAELFFLDTRASDQPGHRGWFGMDPGLPPDTKVSVLEYNERGYELLIGTADGQFKVVKIVYGVSYPDDGGRLVTSEVQGTPLFPIGRPGYAVTHLAYGDASASDTGTRKLVAAVQEVDGRTELHAAMLSQSRTLFGMGPLKEDATYDLTHLLNGEPQDVLVNWEADAVVVGNADGSVCYIPFVKGAFDVRQRFRPFEDLADPRIASMHYVLGDVSIVFTAVSGEMRVWSLYRDAATDMRVWGQTKTFPALPAGGAAYYAPSLRNKAFLTGRGDFASLRYMTTEVIRWEGVLPFSIKDAIIGPRYDRLAFLSTDHKLHTYQLDDKHPVAGWKTYFGKIQYEGQAAPSYEWQSTGGRDDFEKKLSLVPLIMGTLKGTVYALMFAVPIALLGAVYTSQFLLPSFKRFVKPTMEIMASLPSVVLGFLAALWLAPIVSNSVPSVVFAVTGMTLSSFTMGWAWGRLPNRYRLAIKPGYEFLLVIPVVVSFTWLGWELGPVIERAFFVVTDPHTGMQTADFRLWFPEFTGLPFEQRNAFVVGFVMGFAVIPIIFTISEDALTNVPDAFRSGSLALGASRWQTTMRVVVPTASAGIFSALMIGLGRAVGETMIVVMATGNVPVTEFNPFTGMRTLSANIAVELPEAPYLGTLYRTLFLSALLLFLMTFMVNTVAEILRQKLRERYRAVE